MAYGTKLYIPVRPSDRETASVCHNYIIIQSDIEPAVISSDYDTVSPLVSETNFDLRKNSTILQRRVPEKIAHRTI
jgi:hypothetical protein